MKNQNDKELSDVVYVDRVGKFRFTWDIVGEVEGVFEWDELIEFYTTYSDGNKYGE